MKAIHLIKQQSSTKTKSLILQQLRLFNTSNNNNKPNHPQQARPGQYSNQQSKYPNNQGQGGGQAIKINQFNQGKAYKADPKVSLIIKSSPNEAINQDEKERFNKTIRECALGLYKNYKKTSKITSNTTDEFIVNISKNMDGRTFTLFIKYLNELRVDVLENANHKLTPDSFLIFLDKVKNLTHASQLNDLILRKMSSINIDELKTKKMLNVYQQSSLDFKFEENLRMGEIQKFANEVIPKPRFLFDNYKTTPTEYSTEPQREISAAEQSRLDLAEGNDGTKSQAPSSNQQKQEDYFSFFSSHEKVILKPESNFKNLRQFMEFLPIDYYILLQDGFQNPPEFPKSNYIFYSNFPLLQRKKGATQQSIIRNITYEDILRCLDKNEAEELLLDQFAQEELEQHLEKHYGKIKDVFHVNYQASEILKRFEKFSIKDTDGSGIKDIQVDELKEFEKHIEKSKSSKDISKKNENHEVDFNFEDLLEITSSEFSLLEDTETKKSKGSNKKKVVKTEYAEDIVETLRKKEKKLFGLDSQICRSGFLVFEDYHSKLKMMNTPLFLFGMKLYRQQGHMEFFDADFCNTILIGHDNFTGLTLGQCCEIINEGLVKSGFENQLLQVGKLSNIEDFDLSKIIVQEGFKISLRFNDFYNALSAFLKFAKYIDYKLDGKHFKCLFQSPSPNYYDGKLATQFETCIKDKFEGLRYINEIESNYVRKYLEEFENQKVKVNI